MLGEKFDILVLLREVCDPRPPARVTEEGAMIRDRGLRRTVNPADLEALEEALGLVECGASVTAMTVGPERTDDLLRLALSMGASRAIRVWDHAMEGADPASQATVLARMVKVLRPAMLFSGSRLLDRGDEPAAALAYETLGLPSCNAAVETRLGRDSVEVTRKGDRGARQKISLPPPCAVLFEAGFREPRYPGLDAVMGALEAEVEVWGLPDLGLTPTQVGEAGALLRTVAYSFPRPSPMRVTTPSANLPAYDRILALLSGGIQPREGKMHFGSAEEAAEGLFQIFVREGLIPEMEA